MLGGIGRISHLRLHRDDAPRRPAIVMRLTTHCRGLVANSLAKSKQECYLGCPHNSYKECTSYVKLICQRLGHAKAAHPFLPTPPRSSLFSITPRPFAPPLPADSARVTLIHLLSTSSSTPAPTRSSQHSTLRLLFKCLRMRRIDVTGRVRPG